jgi:hypothetical protein
MSDSESNKSFDIEDIAEENQAHIREVLNKGRQLAPFYDVQLFDNSG